MILSETPQKRKQINVLARAHSWRGNFEMVRRAVVEASAAYPLSDMQWYNLSAIFGHEKIMELRRVITEKKFKQ